MESSMENMHTDVGGGGGEGKRLNKHATIYTINIHKFYLIQFSVESHTRLHLRYKVNWDLQKLFT